MPPAPTSSTCVPLPTAPHVRNVGYLRTKATRMGHLAPTLQPARPGRGAAAGRRRRAPRPGPGAGRPALRRAQVRPEPRRPHRHRRPATPGGSAASPSGGCRTPCGRRATPCWSASRPCSATSRSSPCGWCPGASPARVVLDSTLRIPDDATVLGPEAATTIVTTERSDPARRAALRERGVRVEVVAAGADGRVDLAGRAGRAACRRDPVAARRGRRQRDHGVARRRRRRPDHRRRRAHRPRPGHRGRRRPRRRAGRRRHPPRPTAPSSPPATTSCSRGTSSTRPDAVSARSPAGTTSPWASSARCDRGPSSTRSAGSPWRRSRGTTATRSCAGGARCTSRSSAARTSRRRAPCAPGTLLYAIASDSDLRDAKQLRKVTFDGSEVDLDVDESWTLPAAPARSASRASRASGGSRSTDARCSPPTPTLGHRCRAVIVGWHASHEQVAPSALLDAVQRAEAAGFDAAMSLGPLLAVERAAGRVRVRLVVARRGDGHHGAAVRRRRPRRASATTRRSSPRRSPRCSRCSPAASGSPSGTGEASNEHITGDGWPDKATRNARLGEVRRRDAGAVRRRGGHPPRSRRRRPGAAVDTAGRRPPRLVGAAVSPRRRAGSGAGPTDSITVNQDPAALRPGPRRLPRGRRRAASRPTSRCT